MNTSTPQQKSDYRTSRDILPCHHSIILKKASTLVMLLLIMLVWTSPGRSTDIPGGSVSGIWNIEGSPYNIFGSITIPNGDTLEIEPGVQVIFTGHYMLKVSGRLLAIGTETDTIHFTVEDTTGFSNNESTDGGWNGIRFDNTPSANDSSKIVYCKLEYGKAYGPYSYGGAISVDNFSKVLISNCYIANNKAILYGFNGGKGAGIYCMDADIVVQHCIIENNLGVNTGCSGIGIYAYQSDILIHNNIIRNNSFNASNPGTGGGICIYHSTPTITHNTIKNNRMDDGGGIHLLDCTNTLVSNNSICNNTAGSQGGGIKVQEGEMITIENNLIDGNVAGAGAGIYCFFITSLFIRNNTITHNGDSDWWVEGKGILCDLYDGGIVIIENNFISENTDGGHHSIVGGIYIRDWEGIAEVTVRNNIITNNQREAIRSSYGNNFLEDENGIFINNLTSGNFDYWTNIWCMETDDTFIGNVIVDQDSSMGLNACDANIDFINNTISNNNNKQKTGGLYLYGGSNIILKNTILWGNTLNGEPSQFFLNDDCDSIEFYHCDVQGGIGDEIGENNIDADPLFDSTNVDHPYSLTENSPCIDTGTPDTTGLQLPEMDIAGNQRIWDGDGDSIAVIDIGAYEYGAPSVSVINKNQQSPPRKRTQLKQNYPNPFNPITTITYHLPRSTDVQIKIYNSTGKLVRVLIDDNKKAGRYSVSWDGKDQSGDMVPSGIYYYRLMTDHYTKTKKMVLLR